MLPIYAVLVLAGAVGAQGESAPAGEAGIRARHAELMEVLQRARAPHEFRAGAEKLIALAGEAGDADLYELGFKILAQAERTAKQARANDLANLARARAAEFSEFQRAYDPLAGDIAKLSTNPGDPGANLSLGIFLCFYKNEFKRSIPMLAKGSDPFLKRLAASEQGASSSPEEKRAIGDSWWTGSTEVEESAGLTGALATSKTGLRKEMLKRLKLKMEDRAVFWYGRAWEGLEKASRGAVRPRAQAALRGRRRGSVRVMPDGWTDVPNRQNAQGSGIDPTCGHGGEASIKVVPGASLRLGPFPIRKGEKVFLSAWVLTDGNEPGKDVLRIRFLETSDMMRGDVLKGKDETPLPADVPFWTPVEKEATAPDGTLEFDINVEATSKSGAVWLDDFTIRKDGGEIELPARSVAFEK